MRKAVLRTKVALVSCLMATTAASASMLTFINKCSYSIELHHSQQGSAIAQLASITPDTSFAVDVYGPAHMFRHGFDTAATQLEFSFDSSSWYDISIIPPMSGYCARFDECRGCTFKGCSRSGFNVPVSVEPKENWGTGSCRGLYCAADSETECSDAYLYPMDNAKTHNCPQATDFDITFCYGA